jgi:hypothetical protein
MTPAKPLPLVVRRGVDQLTGLEGGDRDLLAEGVVTGVGGPQLDQVAARGDPGALEVALHRLVDLARVDLAVADLDGGIPVGVAADLGDHVGTDLDDGHGNQPVVGVPHLGHAELLAQHTLHCACRRVAHRDVLRA